jgi:uncharacterized membrane protein SpoIIM required for sporulation
MMNPLTSFCILILGATSTVAGYAGLSVTLPHDSIWFKLFSALIAAAIGVSVATFWHMAFEAVLKVMQRKRQYAAWFIVFVGCIMITLISAYWHVAAIGGPAAQTAAIYDGLKQGETALAKAGESRNRYRGFTSRLSGLDSEIGNLMECEASNGCVSGSAGTKGVYGTLQTLQGKVSGIVQSIAANDERFEARMEEGGKCLAEFRSAMSSGVEADGGAAKASTAFDCLNSVIADIDGNGQLERIASEMDGLTSGLVVPVSIKTPAQKQAVDNILSGIRDRSSGIAKDARAGIQPGASTVVSLERMSAMKAVVVYWDAILPAWATGIALDLLPVLLLAFQGIIVGSRRALPDASTHEFTAGDLVKAMATVSTLQQAAMPKPADAPIKAKSNRPVDKTATTIAYRNDPNDPSYWQEDVSVYEDDEDDPGGKA